MESWRGIIIQSLPHFQIHNERKSGIVGHEKPHRVCLESKVFGAHTINPRNVYNVRGRTTKYGCVTKYLVKRQGPGEYRRLQIAWALFCLINN